MKASRAALLCGAALLATAPAASAANVVVLLMDDATATDPAAMPTLQQLARAGTTFDRSFTATPMCGPSRAVIQSGQYPQNNGERQNGYAQFVASGAINRSFPVAVNRTGADTSFVGKYMNDGPSSVPPGWDNFTLQRSGGGGESGAKGYYDYTLGGKSYGHAPGDYSVDVERDIALQYIGAARGPFFLMLAVHSPHNPPTPPQRYAGGGRAGTLKAVDDAMAAIVRQLRADGRYAQTYFVATSDQGLNPGGPLGAKGVPYEGSIRVPLIISGPGVRAGVTRHELVDNADLAPTFAAWMGGSAIAPDGRSLAPLLGGGGGAWRHAVPITHRAMSSAPNVPSWDGVRTDDGFMYVKYQGGGTEVYDLGADPSEKHNIAGSDPALTQRLAALSARLATCQGATCRSIENQSAP
jgi:N-acetylglucosamine-6-sulfatase